MGRASKTLQLTVLVLSVSVWLAAISQPAHLAVAPEYVAACNAVLVISLVASLGVVGHVLWMLMGRACVLVIVPLAYGALIIGSGPAAQFQVQTAPPSSEGFMYDGGWMCSRHVDVIYAGPAQGERTYVLQQYCVPDGPEQRTAYRRRGGSPFMAKLDAVPQGLRCLSSSKRAARECAR
jgi:hypothetical protein